MRLSVLIFTLVCVLGGAMSSAVAEKRIALVIGNNVYRNLSVSVSKHVELDELVVIYMTAARIGELLMWTAKNRGDTIAII